MKNSLKFIRAFAVTIALIICLIVLCGFYNYTAIDGCLKIDKENNALISDSEQIKILQLTDVQFQSYISQSVAFYAIKKTVRKINPDMICFTGDMLDNKSNENHLRAFITFMDSFECPWAVTMGNHDYKSNVSMLVQDEIYSSAENCLYKKGDIESSFGNYHYNIIYNDKAVFSLVFMDSMIDGFTLEHALWYEQTISKNCVLLDGAIIPSFVFYHIPTVDTVNAIKLYDENSTIGTGEINESVDAQKSDVGLFDKIYRLGSTKAVFYGHDHVNNAIIDYNGIKLCYGLKTGRTSYFDKSLQGGNLITLNANGSFDVARIFI